MKLKYLVRLNALLIICSLILNSSQENINLNSDATLAESTDIFVENESSLINYNKLNERKGNEGFENFIEANSEIKSEAPAKKYTITKEANPLLKKDPASLKKMNQYKRCTIKTGISDYVTTINQVKKNLIVKPLFMSIDKVSFNFYESTEEEGGLYSTMRLDQIGKITENFPGTFCITVVNKFNDKSEQDRVNFCLKSEKEKDEWVSAISEMKECTIKVVESQEDVIFDFNKINTLLKLKVQKKQEEQQKLQLQRQLAIKQGSKGKKNEIILPVGKPSAISKEDTLKDLFYDNTFRPNRQSTIVEAKQTQLKKEVGKIIRSIKLGNVAQRQIERKLRCDINRAEKIRKQVEKQKELIKDIMEKREEKEKERRLLLSRKITENKEIQLMRAVGMQIKKIKKAQIKSKKNLLKKQLRAIRGISTPIALRGSGRNSIRGSSGPLSKLYPNGGHISISSNGDIIHPGKVEEVHHDKLTNYSDCTYKDKLWQFKNQDYIFKTCKRYYGENRVDECIQKPNFCRMCCDWHVGASFTNKREECKGECGNYIVGLPWDKKLNKKGP